MSTERERERDKAQYEKFSGITTRTKRRSIVKWLLLALAVSVLVALAVAYRARLPIGLLSAVQGFSSRF